MRTDYAAHLILDHSVVLTLLKLSSDAVLLLPRERTGPITFWPSGSYLKPNEAALDSASSWNDLNTTHTNNLELQLQERDA